MSDSPGDDDDAAAPTDDGAPSGDPTAGAAPDPAPRPTAGPDVTAELPAVTDVPATASRPSPGPRHAAQPSPDDPEPARHPRRWFLAGAGVAVLAGAGGVGAALLRGDPAPKPNPLPAALRGAIAAEQALLADLDATTGGTSQVRAVLTSARADHAAHLQALRQVAASYDPPRAGRAPTGRPRSAAELRAAEASAATFAASRAELLDGDTATLLASIAACEASHADLLS